LVVVIIFGPVTYKNFALKHWFCKVTSQAYDRSNLTGMNLFVLNTNTVYCRIVFANRIECIKCTQFLEIEIKCETSSRRLKSFLLNAPTQNGPSDSRLRTPVKRILYQTPP